MMLEELERRNYSEETTRRYVRFVERFAQHFGKSPDKLGLDHLRSYEAYLLKQQKLEPGSVENHVAALRFFFVRTLHRNELRQFLPYPKVRRKLPNILSREEVARLIDASRTLFEPHPADGSLRHGHASLRGCAAEDRRRRQPAHGHSRGERQGIAAALDRGELPAMAPGTMCYMMSKEQYLNDQGHSGQPHLMFYAADDVAKNWGANLPGSPVMASNDPQARVTIFMVVVHNWSDGTPGPPMEP
jgi:hypothetical protein